MKNLVIDARMVTRIPHGFARYTTRLLEGLRELRELEGGLPYEPILLVHRDTDTEALGDCRAVELAAGFLNPKELIEIPQRLRQLRADLYHSPTFSSLLWCPCPWVVSVHDLNHLVYGGAREKLYYRLVLRQFARRAAALVTVSDFSRAELREWTGIPAERIDVAMNALGPELFVAPDPQYAGTVLERHGLEPGKYFLCVSNPKPHKNVPLLVRAHQAARAEDAGVWPLVLTLQGLCPPGCDGVLEIGGVRDQETSALLHSAGAVVFPSLYEGFGLPPVEAAALGLPLIVSAIPPHREGLRDLAPDEVLWVDPCDQEAWTRALRVATGKGLRPLSDETRRKVRSRYTALALGRNMDQIYRRVLGV